MEEREITCTGDGGGGEVETTKTGGSYSRGNRRRERTQKVVNGKGLSRKTQKVRYTTRWESYSNRKTTRLMIDWPNKNCERISEVDGNVRLCMIFKEMVSNK